MGRSEAKGGGGNFIGRALREKLSKSGQLPNSDSTQIPNLQT